MLNSYLSPVKSAQNNFDCIFHDHEKNPEKIPDMILYGIAERESEE